MKKTSKQILFCIGAVVLLAALAASPLWAKRPPLNGPRIDDTPTNPGTQTPAPVTLDQITHNMGNIVTTVDNFGYVGGYSYYGYPSGQWPRNSGHDYLAEIKYWMGAVTAGGDTLVANTEDDFQAVPSLVSGSDEYKILLSTDTTRYFNYSLSDTVGAGYGNPAKGWREYNLDSSDWVYTRNYSPTADTFFAGGPVSLQESHFRFNDAASGSQVMGLEMTHTMLQWNYCYNEDFIFVILDIKNTSATDYHNFALGVYADFDIGGPDGTGENGRLGDLVKFDSTENLAWTYDADNYDPGWKSETGIMGTKYLETPDNIGMTSFRTGDWDVIANADDPERFALINSSQFDASLPPTDQYYIQCTRGIDLTAGKTVRVVYALIAGENEEDFRANAAMAQELYDNYFVGPQPPATPTLKARAGDGKVYLYWNDTAEVSLDPMTGVQDFVGYKLYRSDNHGKTWGQSAKSTSACLTTDYKTQAAYRIETIGDPIPHTYIDTGLYNGVEYWYCLAAFDAGDTASGFDPLQSGFGVAGTAINTIAVTPHNNPAGYYDAAGTVTHEYDGTDLPSDGTVRPIIYARDSLRGADYAVTFEDTPEWTYWHLINLTTGDTLLKRQADDAPDPTLCPVVEGLQVVLTNAERTPRGYAQTSFANAADTTLKLRGFWGICLPYLDGSFVGVHFGDQHYRSTYEIRFTGDSTLAPNVFDGVNYWLPWEVWNVSSGERVSMAVYDSRFLGAFNANEIFMIINYPYDPDVDLFAEPFPNYYSWLFRFDSSNFHAATGDVFTFEGAAVNGPADRFTFKVDGVNPAAAHDNLSDIKVVPDPYFVQYSARVETSEGESVLEFQKIPDRCTIRIYTLAGDLVQTIEHTDGTGTARWDLLSSNRQQVAPGIYIYHVDSPYGEHLGRFAVIK